MKHRHIPKDAIAYICYIRAVGNMKSINNWDKIISILNDAYEELGNEVLIVVHCAITNLKYNYKQHDDCNNLTQLDKINQIFDWLNHYNIKPIAKTLDTALAVTCEHGDLSEIKNALNRYNNFGYEPTKFTFNTLLGRYISFDEYYR